MLDEHYSKIENLLWRSINLSRLITIVYLINIYTYYFIIPMVD